MDFSVVADFLHPASVGILAQLGDVTLKGSVVLLASLALLHLLQANSAARRHLVLLLGIFSFLAIPTLSMTLPQLRVLPSKQRAERPASGIPSVPMPSGVGQTTAKQHPDSATGADADWAWPSLLGRYPVLPMSIAAIWLFGVAVFFLRTSVATVRLHRIVGRTEPLRGPAWTDLVGAPGWLRVELTRSREEIMPMVRGVLRPNVILPCGAIDWPHERRQAVLGHEVAHLVRFDPLTQTVAQLACILFWFNPLLWMALKKLTEEQEKACDDLAVTGCGSPPDYAEHILKVVAKVDMRPGIPRTRAALADRSQLEFRVRAILDPAVSRDGVSPGVLILSICLTLAVIAPMSMLAQTTDAGEEPDSFVRVTDARQVDRGLEDRSPRLTGPRNQMGRSALHEAARGGDARILIRLLAQGLDPEVADNEGRTPLHLAAGNGRTATVAALLGVGGELEARDHEGRTPLHLAARNGHPAVVKQLLTTGGAVHTTDLEGRTPLASAAANGNLRVVDLLLKSESETNVSK